MAVKSRDVPSIVRPEYHKLWIKQSPPPMIIFLPPDSILIFVNKQLQLPSAPCSKAVSLRYKVLRTQITTVVSSSCVYQQRMTNKVDQYNGW